MHSLHYMLSRYVRFLSYIFLFVSHRCNVDVEWPLLSAVFIEDSWSSHSAWSSPRLLLSYKTTWAQLQSWRYCSNSSWLFSYSLSCLPTAQHQPPSWMGECSTCTSVSNYIKCTSMQTNNATDGYTCSSLPWMPTFDYEANCVAYN